MPMQLTEQNYSHPRGLMYIKNYCTVKSLKLFEKKLFNISTHVFDIYYNSYFNI